MPTPSSTDYSGWSAVASYYASVKPKDVDYEFLVIPVVPSGTRGMFRGWPTKATREPATISKIATKHGEDVNVGLLCDRLLAIDVDGPIGVETMRRVVAAVGELPRTYKVVSPADPTHFKLVYLMPEGFSAKSSTGKFGAEFWTEEEKASVEKFSTKVDIKGWHSLIVAGYARHKTGLVTLVEVGPEELAPAPESLLGLVTVYTPEELAKKEPKGGKFAPLVRDSDEDIKSKRHSLFLQQIIARFPITESSRNSTYPQAIMSLRCKKLDDAEIFDICKAWLEHYGDRFNATMEEALSHLRRAMKHCEENYEIYEPTIEDFALTDQERQAVNLLASDTLGRAVLEIFLRQKHLDDSLHRPNITMTNAQLFAGVEMVTGKGWEHNRILKAKNYYVSSSKPAKTELFTRTSLGHTGKPSTYQPTPLLAQLLESPETYTTAADTRTPSPLRITYNVFGYAESLRTGRVAAFLELSEPISRASKEHRELKAKVKERDRHECQFCGLPESEAVKGLHVVKTGGGWQKDVGNYTTMCPQCQWQYFSLIKGEEIAAKEFHYPRLVAMMLSIYPDLTEQQFAEGTTAAPEPKTAAVATKAVERRPYDLQAIRKATQEKQHAEV